MNCISPVFYKNHIDFVCNNSTVYSRSRIIVIPKNCEPIQFPIECLNNTIYAHLGEFGIYSEVFTNKTNVLCGTISLECKTNTPCILVCPLDTAQQSTPPYYQIPGFLYGTNNANGSDGKQPKFTYNNSQDTYISNHWYTRTDRSTHNCVISVSKSIVCSIGIQEYLEGILYNPIDEWKPKFAYNGLFLDTSETHIHSIGFTLGYMHKPYRYTWVWDDPKTPDIHEYTHGYIYNAQGLTLTATCYYFAQQTIKGIPSYGNALQAHYKTIHTPPKVCSTRIDAMRMCTDAILKYGWNNEHSFFILSDNSDEGRNRGNIGWTGGMQVAYPILKAGIRLQNARYIECATQYMHTISNTAMNSKAHLLYEEFRDGKWHVDGWWGRREDCYNWGDNPLHSAYCNGQAAYYLLKSYLETGCINTQWFNTAHIILETARSQQLKSGAYARFYNPDNGNGVDYTGFQACWFVPGMILLATITHNTKYTVSAQKAIEYYTQFHTQGELYGTPMDTHEAVDEEGNIAYIIGCVEMHKHTLDSHYIELACIGLDYEFSWKFAYNTVFSNEPLRGLRWCSCGGSITSTHNPHIHPMGNLIAGEMYYIYKHTGNEYIASRLKDTCIWGLSTFNSQNIHFGFGEIGFQTEQFFHSDALLLPWWKKHDGGIWEAYLPWASGCIILNAAEDIPDTFFQE